MSDPRQGWPSASGFERLLLCPGSWAAERGLRDHETEDAASGTRVHAAVAGEAVELSDAEADTAAECEAQTVALCQSLRFDMGPTPQREVRLWLDSAQVKFSGQLDFLLINDTRALVIDYKGSWGDVTDATRNAQLMAQAVLVWEQQDADEPIEVEEVYAAIVQPRQHSQPIVAHYDARALCQARERCIRIVREALKPDAVRTPGEKQCKYCKAKSRCPEALGVVPETAQLTIHSILEPCTNDDLARLLDRCGAAEHVIGSIRAEAKRRLADGQVLTGWTLKPGAKPEKIVDAQGVFARCAAKGATAEEFAAICSVTKTALKPLLKIKTGLKGKALDAEMDSVLAGCVETKTTAPQLVRTV